MDKLKKKDGTVLTIRDKEICTLLDITQPTLSRRRGNKTITFKEIQKIAEHYDAEVVDVNRFLGFDL